MFDFDLTFVYIKQTIYSIIYSDIIIGRNYIKPISVISPIFIMSVGASLAGGKQYCNNSL